ncbi:MAG: RluA family pseudouridine synthase [Chloroflexota bacterium]|nr:RluA family pseudouridine synthase [Chloroflexota bacterium]
MSDEPEAMLIELSEPGAVEVGPGEYELAPDRLDLGERLDRFVAMRLPDLSRSYVQQLIERGQVTVDGIVRKQRFKVTPGELVRVVVPPSADVGLEPEAIPLSVIYEDDDVLVIDKPAGLVVHPAPGHRHGTLVNAVLHHVPGISVGGVDRPGIVHRLDKDTSGLMVVAKSDRGHQALVAQWNERAVLKEYAVVVAGVVDPEEATIDAPIARDQVQRQRMAVVRGGREAITHFTVTERFAGGTLLDVIIDTGRTHQIRVHLAFIGHPVVGDKTYGGGEAGAGLAAPRQMLHASRLEFTLPDGVPMSFSAPPPEDFATVVDRLRTETSL